MSTPAADPVMRADENADGWWHSCAMTAIKTLASTRRPFTAYELTEMGVPDPDSPARWGAVFRAAAQMNLIRAVGFAPSRRPTAAGSIARVWRGVDLDVGQVH